MKTLAILILLIPCVAMAETFTMPLSTVDTNPATAATLLGRPEITEYAERVQRIGNVFIIEWNQYDTEAVSVEYKALRPLGVKPPTSFAVDGSDESVDKEKTYPENIETVITDIINSGTKDFKNLSTGVLTAHALDYDYELGKQFILYLHKNHYVGGYCLPNS